MNWRGARAGGSTPFGYQPALDGTRGLAVAMVLVFHGGFPWMTGGYVGVSVFFTLSGYLITSLALVEHDRTERLDVKAFYGRRVRRLLPASLLCLAGVLVMAWRGLFLDDEDLRRDLWGALGQVANWVDLASGESYADLVAGGRATGAPLDHYWSLAIEEQFYWVWPLILLGVLRLRPRRRTVAIAGLFVAFAAAAPLIAWGLGPDAAYWATPARLGEILIGAALAGVLHRRHHHHHRPLPTAVAALAPVGLVVIGWAATTWPAASGPAYDGWLPVFAVASAALILGLQVESPWRRALALRPLVGLGVISYGVYLFHWPIFLAIDERTGLPLGALFAVRVAVTLAVAVTSFILLERPIRTARVSGWTTARAGLAGAMAVAVAIAVIPIGRQLATSSVGAASSIDPSVELAVAAPATVGVSTTTVTETTVAESTIVATTTMVPTTTVVPTTTTDPPPTSVPALPSTLTRPVGVLILGDSTAMSTGDGMVAWAEDHPQLAEVRVVASPGCGFVRNGQLVDGSDDLAAACRELFDERLPEALGASVPDVAVIVVTLTDLLDRVWLEAEGPLTASDDRFIARLTNEYAVATHELLRAGVGRVLWVAPPTPDVPLTGPMAAVTDPLVRQRYLDVLSTLEAAFAGQVRVVDLAGWFEAQADPPERKDGLHWTEDGSRDLADRYLAPVIVGAALS